MADLVLNTEAEWLRNLNGSARLSQQGNVVAQSFKIPVSTASEDPQKQTSIITSIDLWFQEVDARKVLNQVTVEIREMVNGYPGAIDKAVVTSETVKLAATNAVTTPSTTNGVNFKMKKPVKLSSNKDYALVVRTPSSKTKLFVAYRGEDLVTETGIHSKPSNVGSANGSMFVSENMSTWKAYLNADLTFRVNRAKFKTGVSTVQLKNVISDSDYHAADIGAYSDGLTIETYENSYFVKVVHPNHGLNFDGAQVKLRGFSETDTYNGILGSEFNKTFTIKYATLNSYFIQIGAKATESGFPPVPKFDVFANQSLVYDILKTNIPIYKEDNELVTMKVLTRQTNSTNLEVNTNTISNVSKAATIFDAEQSVVLNQTKRFETPKIVRDKENSTANDLVITLSMNNGNEYSSPFFKKDDGINPIVARNVVGQMLSDSDLEGLTTRSLANNETDSDINQQLQFISYQVGLQSTKEHSAYVTNQIDLEIPGDGLTVIFDADMEPDSSVIGAYKARRIGDDTPFEDLEWIDFPNSQAIDELNHGPFSSGPDSRQFEMRVDSGFEFSSFKFRLRLSAQNEAYTPKVSNLRIIADI